MRAAYLWCPAYPLEDAGHCQRTVRAARQLTDAAGYSLIVSPELAHVAGRGCWHPAEMRIHDLIAGLECELLIAARGGYGCLDLVETILAWPRASAPRLVGYSDLTVLHALWWRRRWGETLYGYMPGVDAGERSRHSTVELLRGAGMVRNAVSDPEVVVLHRGAAKGMLFAACLRVLAGLVGTPAMPDLEGCILAIEDIDERPYRIDRDLQQLARSGGLRGVAGLVCGAFPSEAPPGYAGTTAHAIIQEWAARLKIPAVFGLPFGHAADPLTLPCGRSAALACQADGWSLTVNPASDEGSGRS
jgi:muramoyltetrapeptide carboxypeptidase